MNNYRLFLDDARTPKQVGTYMLPIHLRVEYNTYEWVTVKNYSEFVSYIEKNGLPTHISFDHDLADIKPIEGSIFVLASDWTNEKTGYDCAKWLCNNLMENNAKLPICFVHSSNSVGKENIQSLLNSYAKHFK